MNIALTGASGFLGRHVLSELNCREIAPSVVLRGDAGLPDGVSVRHAARFDIRSAPADAYRQLGEPDTLLHLAWGGLPNYSSLHHYEEELPAQYAFLKSMIAGGVRNVVVTGTCFEYGMQSGPLPPTAPARPRNPYGFAKDTLHRQLRFLQGELDFNLVWVRLFYPYGEGQAAGSLYSQLKSAVDQGRPVFDMSGGEQLRDYMPVEEMARDLVDLSRLGNCDETLNLCSGTPVSVRALVEGWIRSNNWKIDLNLGFYPYSPHEPMAFWGVRAPLDRLLSPS